jgi:hypothetical protein
MIDGLHKHTAGCWLLAQLVAALCYKPKDRGFDGVIAVFLLTILPAALWYWGRLSL